LLKLNAISASYEFFFLDCNAKNFFALVKFLKEFFCKTYKNTLQYHGFFSGALHISIKKEFPFLHCPLHGSLVLVLFQGSFQKVHFEEE